MEILPNSGADISPRSSSKLSRMWSFQLGKMTLTDDLHIYPEVAEVLLSWSVVKGLSILPECYPRPIGTTLVSKEHLPTTRVNTLEASPLVSPTPTSEDIMKEFPNVFDGQIKTMDGEESRISIRFNGVKPS